MAEIRGPVRHRRPARPSHAPPPEPRADRSRSDLPGEVPGDLPGVLPGGPGPGRPADGTPGAVAGGDLQEVFTTLARRAKLPTAAGATPRAVLRAAGLPLLMATVVAAAHPLPAAAGPPPAAGPASGPESDPQAWTVTRLEPSPDGSAAATGSAGTSSAGTSSSATGSADAGTPVTGSVPAARVTGTPAPARPPRGDGTPRVTYTVRTDDTLQRVADLSGRSVSVIVEANGLVPGRPIVPGQVLVLPPATRAGARPPGAPTGHPPTATTPAPGRASAAKATPSGATPSGAKPSKAVPAKGTPTKAAPPAKGTPAKGTPAKGAPAKGAPAKAASPARGAPAKAAQPRTTSPVAAHPTRSYVVVSGDTLSQICERANVDLRNVLALNHLRMDSIIRPGQRLVLPAPAEDTFAGRTYPAAVVAAANANRRALAAMKVPSRHQVKTMIVETARRHGVDPALALAVAYQESGFNHRSVSPANAVGVMQVIPSSGRWASSVLGRPLDLLDAQDNVTAGVVLLETLSRSADSPAQAIAGYYQGLSSVRASGVFDDTRRYVANVQTLRARFAKTL